MGGEEWGVKAVRALFEIFQHFLEHIKEATHTPSHETSAENGHIHCIL